MSSPLFLLNFLRDAPIVGRAVRDKIVDLQLDQAYQTPLKFATEWGMPYRWHHETNDGFGLPNLAITVPSAETGKVITLANIESFSVGSFERKFSKRGRIATIGHIATRKTNMRKGMGSRSARDVFRELNARYGVTMIHFRETSSRYFECYPPFFDALGAVLCGPTRHAPPFLWAWEISEIDHVEKIRSSRGGRPTGTAGIAKSGLADGQCDVQLRRF
ncbi:hypothetical protein HJB67_29145 [Rhizobium lentis]|uniref:hypothetical protein n=1 Tax=Rhizobium lentis TaxID=1138194 RepID=UPI001C82BBFC|nr:hypothetical protein [Rhizobium lentis]MBX5013958.1 hypothetical protein [Rhizobium lentis]